MPLPCSCAAERAEVRDAVKAVHMLYMIEGVPDYRASSAGVNRRRLLYLQQPFMVYYESCMSHQDSKVGSCLPCFCDHCEYIAHHDHMCFLVSAQPDKHKCLSPLQHVDKQQLSTSCAGASLSVWLATVVAMGALASYGAPEHGKLMREVACHHSDISCRGACKQINSFSWLADILAFVEC